MPIKAWNETKFYDPINDRDSLRITGFSGSGAYWVNQPLTPAGKSRRAQRAHLLRLVEKAIECGAEPGEVAYSDPAPEKVVDPIFDPDRY